MKTADFWRWTITSETTDRRVKTRHLMTEAEALASHPGAERVPGTLERRLVPDDGEPQHFTAPPLDLHENEATATIAPPPEP